MTSNEDTDLTTSSSAANHNQAAAIFQTIFNDNGDGNFSYKGIYTAYEGVFLSSFRWINARNKKMIFRLPETSTSNILLMTRIHEELSLELEGRRGFLAMSNHAFGVSPSVYTHRPIGIAEGLLLEEKSKSDRF